MERRLVASAIRLQGSLYLQVMMIGHQLARAYAASHQNTREDSPITRQIFDDSLWHENNARRSIPLAMK
jgi:hypothetical protein